MFGVLGYPLGWGWRGRDGMWSRLEMSLSADSVTQVTLGMSHISVNREVGWVRGGGEGP